MKPYAIAFLWLGMQAPTKEVRDVSPEVDEGMCMYVHLTTTAKYHLTSP